MSPAVKTPGPLGPLQDLSKETLAALDAVSAELDKAQNNIEVLKELGNDQTRNQERVDWGRKAVKVIRERYKP